MNQSAKKIPGIILAAGEGKRIGGNKALIKINGTNFLALVGGCMTNAGCDPIVVVGGANSGEVEELANRLGITFALNENWESGQFSSLKTGLANLKQEVVGAMIALVDHPFVSAETYDFLISKFLDKPDFAVIPVYNGRRGHPIIIPNKIINEAKTAPVESNLREIISSHKDIIHEQPVEDPGILKDIDSSDDLERLRTK